MFRIILIFGLAGLLLSAAGDAVTACERCSVLGTTIFHDASHHDDPMTRPVDLAIQGDGGQSTPPPSVSAEALTLTYSYQNMFDRALKMPNGQPLPASLIRGSIEEALRLWSSVAPLNFVEVVDNGLDYSNPAAQFGELRFRHVYINGPDPAVGPPVAKAQAYYPSGGVYSRDVEFDHGDPWQEVGTLSVPDILGAAIHEIGHTLGMYHSTGQRPNEFWYYMRYNSSGQLEQVAEPKGDANMYWIFTRYTGLGTGQLFQGDIDVVQSIYGAGSGGVTPLATPEPATLLLTLVALMWLFAGRVVRGGPGRSVAS